MPLSTVNEVALVPFQSFREAAPVLSARKRVTRAVTLLAIGALLLVTRPARIHAQTATCITTQDSVSLDLRSWLRQLIAVQSQGAAAMRSGLGLALTDSTKVVLFTDQRKCASLLPGVNKGLSTPNMSRSMYVYVLGKDYAVYSPGGFTDEGGFVVFLDSRFALKRTVMAHIRTQ